MGCKAMNLVARPSPGGAGTSARLTRDYLM